MSLLTRLAASLKRATLVQAARVAEAAAWREGRGREIGRGALPQEEPLRVSASERMGLVANDLAAVEVDGQQARITANVMGLAGATPALPPPYSEIQLQRRRARDSALSQFFAIFDHRSLSFFYRIAQKFRWPLLAERAGRGEADPVGDFVLALAGFGDAGTRRRLDIADASLITLSAHLADSRRSAASVEAVLRGLTGLPLRVTEAEPVWMAGPTSEQTRIGGPLGQFTQLGDDPGDSTIGMGQAAMIGASVLDIQHHYGIEIGPLSHRALQEFCCRPNSRRIVSQLAALTAGIEQRGAIRLLIAHAEIPGLRLGDAATPALLGWTTWLGPPEGPHGIARDCVMPMDMAAIL
mgnify:CR=1 FL=1